MSLLAFSAFWSLFLATVSHSKGLIPFLHWDIKLYFHIVLSFSPLVSPLCRLILCFLCFYCSVRFSVWKSSFSNGLNSSTLLIYSISKLCLITSSMQGSLLLPSRMTFITKLSISSFWQGAKPELTPNVLFQVSLTIESILIWCIASPVPTVCSHNSKKFIFFFFPLPKNKVCVLFGGMWYVAKWND